MVLCAVSTVAILGTGGAATPIVAAAAGPSSALTGTTVTAFGASAGAATAGAASAGAATAGATAGAGAAAPAVAALTTNPVGWVILGAKFEEKQKQANSEGLTWNCYKPVIRDFKRDEPDGVPLIEILEHPNVTKWSEESFGKWSVVNKWDEKFEIRLVSLPSGQIAAHAFPIDE